MRLLQVRGLPQVFVGVQVDVGVVLPLRRVAVALIAFLKPLGVGLLVVLLALPVRLVRVQVGVFEMVTVVEPGWGTGANASFSIVATYTIKGLLVPPPTPTYWKP